MLKIPAGNGILDTENFLAENWQQASTRGVLQISLYPYFDNTYRSHGDGVITYKWELNKSRYQQALTIDTIAATVGMVARMATGLARGNHHYALAQDVL